MLENRIESQTESKNDLYKYVYANFYSEQALITKF